MRPPDCAVCGERFDPADGGGGLVEFQPDEASRRFADRVRRDGIVGHPPNKEWFCGAHIAAARDRSARATAPTAVAELREQPAPSPADDRPHANNGHPFGDELRVPSSAEHQSSDRFGPQEWIAWSVEPLPSSRMEQRLIDALVELLPLLGFDDLPELASASKRDWTPMDGAQPPWCPFVDTFTSIGDAIDLSGRTATVVVTRTVSCWSENEVNSARVKLNISTDDVDGASKLSIATSGETGAGDVITSVWLWLPTTQVVIDAVDGFVSGL